MYLPGRVVLLAMLVVCCNGTFSIEQPKNSVFEYYPRWREFANKLSESAGDHSAGASKLFQPGCSGQAALEVQNQAFYLRSWSPFVTLQASMVQ